MYGAETWALTKRDENLLNTWERKVLRRIFGAVCINNEWKIRTNAELEELYKAPKIVADIKAHRLRWLGIVEGMGQHRVPKKVLNMKPEDSRSVGRPRQRWLDSVENDLRSLNIRNWRRLASSREEWRKQVVDMAVAPEMMMMYLPTSLTEVQELSTFVGHTFLAPLYKISRNSL